MSIAMHIVYTHDYSSFFNWPFVIQQLKPNYNAIIHKRFFLSAFNSPHTAGYKIMLQNKTYIARWY